MLIKKIFRPNRTKKVKYSRSVALLGCPQRKGFCKRVYCDSPKKPNSAKRKLARVLMTTKQTLTVYVPGETHNLQNFSVVLVRGGRVKDMPGVNYRVIRGKFDCHCLSARKQGRSKVGTKALKNVVKR